MIQDFHLKNISVVETEEFDFKLDSHFKGFFIGSCFSANLFKKFKSLYLNVKDSPFGNIYNPVSLGKSLNTLLNKKEYTEADLINIDGLYHSFDFYSKLGEGDKKDYLNKINTNILESSNFLLESNLLTITLGTAFVYEMGNSVVNNCHKLHSSNFIRRELSIDEIIGALREPLKKLLELNSNINIVITLSPVRHLRDSASENSYSKALLRVAIEKIADELNINYFPSYEILLDELRDYRWYNRDLSHPTETAVDYITERFLDSCKSRELNSYLKRANKIKDLTNHKILNIKSESAEKFIIKRESSINQFKKDYPHIVFN